MEFIDHNGKLQISKVVAGCMRIKDAGLTPDQLMEFVAGCLEMGINAFDHAPVYGGYTCEEMFGEQILKRNPSLRSRIKLISKTGIALPGVEGNKNIYYHSGSRYILAEVEQSLRKLHTDYLDLLLIHRYDPLGCPSDTAEALNQLVRDGKVLHLGVSNYTPRQVEALQKYLAFPLLTNQIELSAKNTDHFFDGSIDHAFKSGMSLMAWSPLGGGSVFTGSDEAALRLRKCLSELSEKYGVSMDVLLYAWMYRHPADIMVITGTLNVSRIKAAVAALEVKLSRDDWYGILQASRGYPVP